jgi:hypothetical protein
MSSISALNGAAFLQSMQTTGNWMLDASNATSSDWMNPSSSGPDVVNLAANAFASAHVTAITFGSNFAVNKGITTLQNVLSTTSAAPGQAVNFLA